MANTRRERGVSSPPSSSREDVMLDDDHLPGLLKGLINQQKLQGAWSSIGNRLRSAEDGLAKARERLDKLPQEFVRLPAYKDLVETSHAEQLESHRQALEQLNDLTGRLSNVVFNEHQSELQDSLARLTRQEDLHAKMQQEAEESHTNVKDFSSAMLERLGKADSAFQQLQDESGARHGQLQDDMQERFTKLWDELKGCEGRMQTFAQGMCESAIRDALSFNEVGDTQRQLLGMIDRELVDAVRQEHLKIHDRVIKLSHDHDVARTESVRQIRIVEQKASSCQDGLNTFKKDMHHEMEKHPHINDVEALEQSLRTDLTGLSGICEGLQTRTTLKLNEFVDHLGKLHETIDDHEHCLRHHAEEIENRSTKYDLLLSQSQIDKCVEQDQHDAQLADLKGVVAWQTSKIENFGLGKSSGSKSRKGDKEPHSSQSARRLMAPSQQQTDRSDTSLSHRSALQVGKDGEPEAHATDTGGSDEVAELAGPDAAAVDGPAAPAIPATPITSASPTACRVNVQDVAEADQRGSLISVSTRDVSQQQVEALAMALVSMAHMVLAPPKLGQSNQARNDLKSELLEQLRDLRHWVTHQTIPPGWDPSKLTTMALRLAHQDPGQNSGRSSKTSKRHDPQAAEASYEDNQTDSQQKKTIAQKGTTLRKALVQKSRYQSSGAEAADALSKRSLFAGSPLQDEEPRKRYGEHNMPELDIVMAGCDPSANNVSGPSHSARMRSLTDPSASQHHASFSARLPQRRRKGDSLPPLTSSGQAVGFSHAIRCD